LKLSKKHKRAATGRRELEQKAQQRAAKKENFLQPTSVYCGSAAAKPAGICPNISFRMASDRRRISAVGEPSSASSGGTNMLLTGAGAGPQLAPTSCVSICRRERMQSKIGEYAV
jgi:hypothetical protein